jgi:hypothetical protein
MNRKLPESVIHGVTSRLSQRSPDASVDAMKSKLAGEHDMSRPLTFVVKGYRDTDFHVMIALRDGHWKVSILVVTSTILLTCPDIPKPWAAEVVEDAPKDPSAN